MQASKSMKGKGSTGRLTSANLNNSSWLWKQSSHPNLSFFPFLLPSPPPSQTGTGTVYFHFWAGFLAKGQFSPLPLMRHFPALPN